MVAKERQLTRAERKLQEDAMAFEEFLRENDHRSVDALKMFVFFFTLAELPFSPPPFFLVSQDTAQHKTN